MRQVKPIPKGLTLEPTLARRIFQLREFRNMTVKDLSSWSRFPSKRIEDLEAGLETWLSSTDRQLLAKALSIEPWLLEEVETRQYPSQNDEEFQIACRRIYREVLMGTRTFACPACGGQLKCSVQEALDLEGYPIRLPKAFCLSCPFVLR